MVLLVILFAGCATTQKPQQATTSSGGYYQDDGPGESAPPNLEATPDTIPRNEPPHRFANRPYQVLGSRYVPEVNDKPYKRRGIASWYGRKFHGKKTASGEPYDMYGMTAAHATLPIPSYVRVTHVKNNKSVLVRINDRGPFHSQRLIDLSYTAALKLGLLAAGSGMVEVERVFADDPPPGRPTEALVMVAPQQATQAETSSAASLYLQLGAFSTMQNAQSFRDRLQRDLAWLSEKIQIFAGDDLYRVRLGPYRSQTDAAAIADKIRPSLNFVPHIAAQ
ncbi:MAG: septal ring lytic transglycosylase RlpA family protein [Burkholderiales bacterium]|nr:septal ring lytic transglycosylase RlpA family protein [Burkholderiales bacterium]